MAKIITQEKLEKWLREALERGDRREASLLIDLIGCCEEQPDGAAFANDRYNKGFSDGMDSVASSFGLGP